VDASLALGDGHPLHPVGTGLVVHPGPHAVALERHDHLVVATQVGRIAAQHLAGPPQAGGEGPVHLEQVAREQVGLLAALRPPDLDDHVALVVGVLGQQQHPQLAGEPLDVGLRLGRLGAQQLPLVAGRVRQHLARRLQVLLALPQHPGAGDDGLELAVALGHLLVPGLVRDQCRIAQARLDL
jgi:hypothetical protein